MYIKFFAALTASVFLTGAQASSYEVCGPLKIGFGPFDYRTIPAEQKQLVEGAHFTREVEMLVKGNSTQFPGGDLSYTLGAMPNHHRALMSMMNLSFKEKRDKPRGSRYTVDCWFYRAIRFSPDDGMVRMIHGIYLLKRGRQDKAIDEFEEARKTVGDNANLHYNLGLAYFEAKNYDSALFHAQEAYRLGFPLEGLRRKLTAAGKWREPIVSNPGAAGQANPPTSESASDPNPSQFEKPAQVDTAK